MLGEDLGSCSIDELQQLEQQLEKSVGKIRARKVFYSILSLSLLIQFSLSLNHMLILQIEVFEEQIKELRQKVQRFNSSTTFQGYIYIYI